MNFSASKLRAGTRKHCRHNMPGQSCIPVVSNPETVFIINFFHCIQFFKIVLKMLFISISELGALSYIMYSAGSLLASPQHWPCPSSLTADSISSQSSGSKYRTLSACCSPHTVSSSLFPPETGLGLPQSRSVLLTLLMHQFNQKRGHKPALVLDCNQNNLARNVCHSLISWQLPASLIASKTTKFKSCFYV